MKHANIRVLAVAACLSAEAAAVLVLLKLTESATAVLAVTYRAAVHTQETASLHATEKSTLRPAHRASEKRAAAHSYRSLAEAYEAEEREVPSDNVLVASAAISNVTRLAVHCCARKACRTAAL
eukprot:14249-Heterococcus_DN1.PRE.4